MTMSFYFAIIGLKDNPLFEHEFGTSKQGGDGIARFREEARHMNPFIVHASLDIVEEVQWANGQMYEQAFQYGDVHSMLMLGRYLKHVDRFHNSYIHCFLTGGNIKFLLLTSPDSSRSASSTAGSAAASRNSTYSSSAAYNPTAPATEEAIKNFFLEVYDAWMKTLMSPFYRVDMPIRSPVFRQRIVGAGKKYL